MRITSSQIRLSATDLSNHLACNHVTSLDLSVVRGEQNAPVWRSPDLAVIQELGMRHEAAYLKSLQDSGVKVVDLRELKDEKEALKETRKLMERGTEAISQGSIGEGRWFGRPDVLRRVQSPSELGKWSYEVYDCKLSRETKATTILQLSLYSDLVSEIQGVMPELLHVVPAGGILNPESYRTAEFAAYYRYVKARLEKSCDETKPAETYPEPCPHCEICYWYRDCNARRRADDHLSLVAGITRLQRKQLDAWQTATVEKLAVLPIPLTRRPLHGSKESYVRVREQARVQVKGRTIQKPVHEVLAVVDDLGFCKLPKPSPGDIFIDLEGDPFAGNDGHQYLFGAVSINKQKLSYEKRWAFTPEQEKDAFVWIVDEILRLWNKFPTMHIYHFGAYEPSAFKRLMGKYVTREDEVDRVLRAGLFVDLHSIFKQAIRASVEEYSLKALEEFHGFVRKAPLADARQAMRFVEHQLEMGWDGKLPDEVRQAIESYNEDDCRSTASLRDWLEAERTRTETSGTTIARPTIGDGAPSEELDDQLKRVAKLVEQLISTVPIDPAKRSDEESARWLLASTLDYHRRENKASWWEGFRLQDLKDEELLDDRAGLAALRFTKRVAVERGIPVDRYTFDKQETELRGGKDVYRNGQKIGSVAAIDLAQRTIDIKKTRNTADVHASAIYMWDSPRKVTEHAGALLRLGEWVRQNGVSKPGNLRAARDLLLRKTPRLSRGESVIPLRGENPKSTAIRVACALDHSVFAIQGPPGAGKTYTGARMICELVKQGKKVGITALSHQVIRKLLEEVVIAAEEEKNTIVKCMQKSNDEEETQEIRIAKKNGEAVAALASRRANVVGGTSWLWSPLESFEAVDVLFIDEAGQMALADVLAVAQAAKSLVLIGDPQQLERPSKGSHPDGADTSALQHLLGDRKTIPETMGLLLPETWRMHPKICSFTSELFYDGRLSARGLTKNRVLSGHPWLNGAGLWFVPVEHEGNRNSSPEEADVVSQIVKSLISPGITWSYSTGNSRKLTLEDILIVAPYNAQVSDLCERLPAARIGTVDKFQGQEAPVVIYSLTTSSPEDAPRGMEFLYSLNRFNVATSRGMTSVIVVGSPRLCEPECRSPRQMQLANALCRYRELATTKVGGI